MLYSFILLCVYYFIMSFSINIIIIIIIIIMHRLREKNTGIKIPREKLHCLGGFCVMKIQNKKMLLPK